jgi:hypothetical protein
MEGRNGRNEWQEGMEGRNGRKEWKEGMEGRKEGTVFGPSHVVVVFSKS